MWGRYEHVINVSKPFVAFDLETTGLQAGFHEIIEVAAVKIDITTNQQQYVHSLVTPDRMPSRKITELTGITPQMLVEEGTPICDVLDSVLEFIGDLPVVAYNLNFDLPFLTHACQRHGRSARRNANSCALNIARVAWPDLPNHKLDTVAGHLKISQANQHRALGDAVRAGQVYVYAITTIGARTRAGG